MQLHDAWHDASLSRLLADLRTTVHADTVVVTKVPASSEGMTPAHALCAFFVALQALETLARSTYEGCGRSMTIEDASPAPAFEVSADKRV